MFYRILSYIFYIIAIFTGYLASYELLVQAYPGFGVIGFVGWFFVTAMFFPLFPLYPGIVFGNWMLGIICYICIIIGVIFANQAKKLKA